MQVAPDLPLRAFPPPDICYDHAVLRASIIIATFVLACACGQGGTTGTDTATDGSEDLVEVELVDVVAYDLRLGNWNIQKLGQEPDHDYPVMVAVIEENFDVVAIEEVMVADGAPNGFFTLLSALGPGWDGWVTSRPRPNALTSYAEYYAVVWRVGFVRPCPGWVGLIYHEDNPGGVGGTGENLFSREPAFVCLQAGWNMQTEHATVGFDLVLAAYHALWASGDETVTSAEVDHIDDVFVSMAGAVPGEGDLLVAGDFNLDRETVASLVDAEVLTVGTGSTLTTSGGISDNLIDHVLILDTTATSELASVPQVLDVRSYSLSDILYRETVSDHLPVRARFTVDVDDD